MSKVVAKVSRDLIFVLSLKPKPRVDFQLCELANVVLKRRCKQYNNYYANDVTEAHPVV